MNDPHVLGQLCLVFLNMSLIAIGGSNAALTAYQYEVVNRYQWMSNETFAQLFVTAQLAPGPNVTVVTLIGWQVAGLAGAMVATLSMLLPACFLAFVVGRLSSRFIDTRQYRVARNALVPLAIGLLLSSGLNLAAMQVTNSVALLIVVGCAALIIYLKANPIWVILLGALVSYVASVAGIV